MPITQREVMQQVVVDTWERSGSPPVPMDRISLANLQAYRDIAAQKGYADIVKKCESEAMIRHAMLGGPPVAQPATSVSGDQFGVGDFTSLCEKLVELLKQNDILVQNYYDDSWVGGNTIHCQYKILINTHTTNDIEIDSITDYIQYLFDQEIEQAESKFNIKVDLSFQHMMHDPQVWIAISTMAKV